MTNKKISLKSQGSNLQNRLFKRLDQELLIGFKGSKARVYGKRNRRSQVNPLPHIGKLNRQV